MKFSNSAVLTVIVAISFFSTGCCLKTSSPDKAANATAGVKVQKGKISTKTSEKLNVNNPNDYEIYFNKKCAMGIADELEDPIAFFSPKAESGNPKAQYMLADCYYHGEGTPVDFAKAVKWFEKSASQENVLAIRMLASCLLKGKGVEKQPERAVKLYETAAELGDIRSMKELANAYSTDKHGVKKDMNKAFIWFEKAAELGDLESIKVLAGLYSTDKHGVKKDINKTIIWFEKAAELGDLESINVLAGAYLTDEHGVKKDIKKAFMWLEKAVSKGDLASLETLVRCYSLGEKVKQDRNKAISLIQKAIKNSEGLTKNLYEARLLILEGKYRAAYYDYQKIIASFTQDPASFANLKGNEIYNMLAGFRFAYLWFSVSILSGENILPKPEELMLSDKDFSNTESYYFIKLDELYKNPDDDFKKFGEYLKRLEKASKDEYYSLLRNEYSNAPNKVWAKTIKKFEQLNKEYVNLSKAIKVVVEQQRLSTQGKINSEKAVEIEKEIAKIHSWIDLHNTFIRLKLFDKPVLEFAGMTINCINDVEGLFAWDTDQVMKVAIPFSALTTRAIPHTILQVTREGWFNASKLIKKALSDNEYKEIKNLSTKVIPSINIPEKQTVRWP